MSRKELVFVTVNPNLTDFEAFKKLPKRQAFEALNALVCVIQHFELQEQSDNYRKIGVPVGAFELGLYTATGHELMVESKDGDKISFFHDLWTACQSCGEEVENEELCSIEQEYQEDLFVCPDCFTDSKREGEE